MKQYQGFFDGSGNAGINRVENGVETPLAHRLDLRNHSPDGFSWGYSGSGPSQAALAILADHVGDEKALQHYQDFKRKVIARMEPGQPFTLPAEQIDATLAELSQGRSR